MHKLYVAIFIYSLFLIPAWAWGKNSGKDASSASAPHFTVVPLDRYKEGQGQVASLQGAAGTETFLDKMLGTNCYTKAVKELQKDCTSMDQVQKSRLALRLANCQLATQGQGTFPCAEEEPLRKCVERLPDRENYMYIEFLTHVDSMCLFIQNQEFEKHTEQMLNRLAEGAVYAREQLGEIGTRTQELSQDAAAIRASTEDAIARLREHRELQLTAMDAARQHRAESAAKFSELSMQQKEAILVAERQLELGKELETATRGVEKRVIDGQTRLDGMFSALGEKALALAEAQDVASNAQQKLSEQLQGLTAGSQGLRTTVDAIAEYQRRSDAALIKLLGRSYTLEDAAFYGAGVLAAMATSASKATEGARLPVLGLLGVSVLAERVLVDRLHLWLDVDAAGEVILNLPTPLWMQNTVLESYIQPNFAFNFKWGVRRACAAVAALLIAFTIWSYRDYERAIYRRLEEIHQDIQQKHESMKKYHEELLNARIEALANAGPSSAAAPRRGGGGAQKTQQTQQQTALVPSYNDAKAFGYPVYDGVKERPQPQQQAVALLPSPEQPQERVPSAGGLNKAPSRGRRKTLSTIQEENGDIVENKKKSRGQKRAASPAAESEKVETRSGAKIRRQTASVEVSQDGTAERSSGRGRKRAQ